MKERLAGEGRILGPIEKTSSQQCASYYHQNVYIHGTQRMNLHNFAFLKHFSLFSWRVTCDLTNTLEKREQ